MIDISPFYTIDSSGGFVTAKLLHKEVPLSDDILNADEGRRSRYILTKYLMDLYDYVYEHNIGISDMDKVRVYASTLDFLGDEELIQHAVGVLSTLVGVRPTLRTTLQTLYQLAPDTPRKLYNTIETNGKAAYQIYTRLLQNIRSRSRSPSQSPSRPQTSRRSRGSRGSRGLTRLSTIRSGRNMRIQNVEDEKGGQKETEKEFGLKFSDEFIVRKFSGPISVRVMQPHVDDMPVILLLGDEHFTYTEMCEECDEGCYDLRSPAFFEQLEQTPYANKVSVFLEFFDLALGQKGKPPTIDERFYIPGFEGGVMHDILSYAIPCMRPEHRRLTDVPCFTRHLKWHMADIRAGMFLSGEPSIELALNVLAGSAIFPYLTGMDDRFKKVVSTIVNSIYDPKTKQIRIDRFAETFAKEVMHPDNVKYSMIAKQVRKHSYIRMTPTRLKDMLEHAMVIQMQLDSESVRESKENELLALLSQLKNYDYNLGDIFFTPELWDRVGPQIGYFVSFMAALLDVYTVFRMLKPTRDTKLSIAYLGDAHITAISSLLYTYFGYTELYNSTKRVRVNRRCVTIKDSIDIAQMVKSVVVQQSFGRKSRKSGKGGKSRKCKKQNVSRRVYRRK